LGTATLSSGTATLSASISAAGIYSLTAVYSGSIRYATSTSNSVPVTVSGASLACHVTYTINNQWPGGFGAALAIKNTGTTAWTSWTLTWTFANGQTVSQFWGGNETQSGANIMVTNMSYNGSLAAGASYTGAGFNGTWNSVTNAVPTSFAINGTVCQ
jgi:hypothetical protein